jgi:hypothetical protein
MVTYIHGDVELCEGILPPRVSYSTARCCGGCAGAGAETFRGGVKVHFVFAMYPTSSYVHTYICMYSMTLDDDDDDDRVGVFGQG